MSRFATLYAGLAAVFIGLYTWSTASGWEYFQPARQKTTEEAKRQGYRGGHFIFIPSGGRGGK